MWHRVRGSVSFIALLSFACGKSTGGAPDENENTAGSMADGFGRAGAGGGRGGGAEGPAGAGSEGTTTSSGGQVGSGGPTTNGGGSSAGTSGGGSGGTGQGGMQGSGAGVGAGGAATAGTDTAGTGTGGSSPNTVDLDGLRLDCPCGTKLSGNVCLYPGRQDDGMRFSAMVVATMSGTPGTRYQVALHIRGVTGMTSVVGGVPGSPENFLTGGTRYPDNTNQPGASLEQWRITTSSPSQHYYLNAYDLATADSQRKCVLIDMVETIPIDGGATVTLDVYDSNAHETSNTIDSPPLAPQGVPGSVNSGQFIQINVDSVTM